MRVHFMGIGGSGIAGVAYLAEKLGYEVSGCDLEKSTAYGQDILQGHDPDHIKNADLVVVSPAVFYQNNDNPEVIEAKKQGKLFTWQQFLGEILLKDKKLICIAGTHGKSTTTAMAGKLLIDNGFDPTVVVGAKVHAWRGNSYYGKGKYAIVEADEFNDNFLFYYPEIAIINNVEFDHPDFFKNETQVRESFDKFIKNLKGRKLLITQKDSLNKKFNLKILGSHNQKNANMVFLLGKALGISEDRITKSIESFTGIERRLEFLGKRSGVIVYDDYAHHPTAIAASIKAVREKYPNSRIWAIDEPHGFARTNALLSNYKDVFKDADKVLIGPIFRARDKENFGIAPSLVAEKTNHKDAKGFDSFDDIRDIVLKEAKHGDVVLVMGAGKSYLWSREILQSLPISFSDLTTFGLGGKIEKYYEIKDKMEIEDTISQIKKLKLPVFIIGEGSDILVSDKSFNGAVIKYIPDAISFGENGEVVSEAGANWDKLVEESVNKGFSGIESLSGIPGTVGASPIQNIGAYGAELKDTFVSLEAFDMKEEKFVTFTKDQCKFGYRESIFKQKKNWQRFIITSVTLKLTKGKYAKTEYDSLKKYISSKKPTIGEIREAVLKARNDKLENPKEVGNAGSFFKNPIIGLDKKKEIEFHFPNAKIFPFEGNTPTKGNSFKVYAGWLIEETGWKGKTYKSAAVSQKHSLILINKDGKSIPQDVFDLSEKIIADVYTKFGIKLEREVQLINFD